MNREQVIERLKQIKTNLQNYPMDAIADITFLLERLTGFCKFITNPEDCKSIYVEALERGNKDLVAENQRLKEQLDREIKINRKMKSCLSAFARRDNWKAIDGCADWLFLLDPLMAEETLKEIENKE